MHSPLALFIMISGVNDFQAAHTNTASLSALGSERSIELVLVRDASIEPGMPVPDILLIGSPVLGEPKGAIVTKFQGAPARNTDLTGALNMLPKRSLFTSLMAAR